MSASITVSRKEAGSDVDTAILSHLHQDHIGGIGELKDADLLVSAAESAELSRPTTGPRRVLRQHIQMPGAKWHQISLEPTADPKLRLLAPPRLYQQTDKNP